MEALRPSRGGRFGTRRLAAVKIAFLFALALGAAAARAQAGYLEDAVKAAYLYRFTQYVEWPANRKAPFVIAVMDSPQVAGEISKLLASHPPQNGPVQVRTIHSNSEIADAAVLYVGPEPSDRLRSVIAAVATRPLLLVTESEEGFSLGSTINFVKIDKHIRFEVSTAAAERSKLRVSSELLAVAVRVERSAAP